MSKELQTPFVTFRKRAITARRSKVLSNDNRLAQNVASPLFRAGVRVAGLTQRTREYASGFASRPYHSITLLLQGGMKLHLDDRTHAMEPGEMFCCPVGIPFERASAPSGSWWLYFQINDVPAWEPVKLHGPYVRANESASLMFHLVHDILDGMTSHEPTAAWRGLASSRRLVTLLRQEVVRTQWEQSRHAAALKKLVDDISLAPERDWKRTEMARRLNLSVRQMTLVCREQLGVSPHQLVVRQRINRAVELLGNSQIPIKRIASDLGYESLHSFTRLFSKHVGLPPGRYRDRFGAPLAGKRRTGH